MLTILYSSAFLLAQSCCYLTLAQPWGISAVILLAVVGFFTIKKEALRKSHGAIVYCQQTSSIGWLLRTRAGKSRLAHLKGKPFRSPWLIVLPLQILAEQRP